MKDAAAENYQALRMGASEVSAKLGVFMRADDRVYNLAGRGRAQSAPCLIGWGISTAFPLYIHTLTISTTNWSRQKKFDAE